MTHWRHACLSRWLCVVIIRMGTVEATVLLGVAKNHGNKPRDLRSWLEDLGGALSDITLGLDTSNSLRDSLYHRKKITSFLFVRLFDYDTSVKAFHSKWMDLHASCDSGVPRLSYHDFFDSLSFLGLGVEFTSLGEIIDVHVQEVLGQHLCDWLKSKTVKSEDIAVKDPVVVILFIASLVITPKITSQDSSLLISAVNKCHELLSRAIQSRTETTGVNLSNTYFQCMKHMFKVIEFKISAGINNIANVETPDVMYLSRLIDTLTYNLNKNTLQEAITDRISLDKSLTVEGNIVKSQGKSPYFRYVEESLDHLHATAVDAAMKETCDSLKMLLNLDAHEDVVTADFLTKASMNKDDVYVVANCLDGYGESTDRILSCMVNNPLGFQSWKEAVACFQSSPQCLAKTCNLLHVVDIISQCTKVAHSDMTELSTIAFEFQKLFWEGFQLLPVKSKYNLAKKIIFDRKDYSLLSNCMVKTGKSDAAGSGHTVSDQQTKKVIRKFFEKIIDQDDLNDQICAEFSYICLLSPSLSLENLVENAFYNRLELFASLLLEWDYLLQFPYEPNHPCLLWQKFFDCLKFHFTKKDGKCADNGLTLIMSLFEKSTSESISLELLVKEGFDIFGKSFSGDSQSDPITSRMHLSVLHAFSKSEIFQILISPEELLSLCIALGAKIDLATSSWQNGRLYNKDDDLLDEVFEAMFAVALKQIARLKDQNNDEFVMLTKWFSHIVKAFTWSTQLRFLALLEQVDGFILPVPACLAEVCKIPSIFRPDVQLCYGTGNGLLAWHQCFVINSNICPVHSLNIEFLEAHEIKIFTNAWIVTLAQILPFCKTSQWLKLIETTKLLITECKLYCPYQYTHLAWLSNIPITEAHALLGVVQVMKSVFAALCNKELVDWYSKLNFVSLSKHFSEVCNWLVSVSPEFAKASLLSQAFITSHIFCSVCYVSRLIRSIRSNQVQPCLETHFILSLELLGTFEKIIITLCDVTKSNDETSSDDASTSSLSYFSCHDSHSPRYCILELTSRIEEMAQSSSSMYKEQSEILVQKLQMLNKTMDEIRSHTFSLD